MTALIRTPQLFKPDFACSHSGHGIGAPESTTIRRTGTELGDPGVVVDGGAAWLRAGQPKARQVHITLYSHAI